MRRLVLCSALALLSFPGVTFAAEEPGKHLDLPAWSAAPFVVMLLCIAVLPLVAGHFWHKNRNKFIISMLLGLPVVGYLFSLRGQADGESLHLLQHGLVEYLKFIVLLGSLFTISGGILVEGDLKGTPRSNAVLLLIGAMIANFIGTTGASMLLIRPYLRMNAHRQGKSHLPIFFIFMVSNIGGLLTPLGDPPLFLGFLRGVSFFWTFQLWKEWLMANGGLLLIFFVWDSWAYSRESGEVKASDDTQVLKKGIRLRGLINFLFLAGVIGAVLLEKVFAVKFADVPAISIFGSPGLMVLMGGLSLLFTPKGLRKENGFDWGPIVEVAALFIGIFITMVPALALLDSVGQQEGFKKVIYAPWHYFWLTGSLSAFLDNAPTYVTFAQLAASDLPGSSLAPLMEHKESILAAISCGAVFLGAMTYIGNGPNFMVKAITEESGIPMPSFFGYLGYSCLILLPLFVAVTFVFFRP